MSYRVRTVDVFTARPLAGNQLAMVLDADGLDPGKMQDFAREMNISETTYVLAPADPAHAARVRIFTPTAELAFAGHPTIGTAWVIRDEGLIPAGAESLVLEEGIGPVPVRGRRAGRAGGPLDDASGSQRTGNAHGKTELPQDSPRLFQRRPALPH